MRPSAGFSTGTDPRDAASARLARAATGGYRSAAHSTAFTMPKITYIDHSGTARTVDAEVGATVMETAIKNGVPGIEAECGGACACATCHVHVDDHWYPVVGPPSPMEEDMLDFGYDVRPNSRLSCQIKVTDALDGLVVTTPERQG
jgi:2Fe-2S ferredoxin